jgi:hypothetical protein
MFLLAASRVHFNGLKPISRAGILNSRRGEDAYPELTLIKVEVLPRFLAMVAVYCYSFIYT